MIYQIIKQKIHSWLERSNFGYRLILWIKYGTLRPRGYPDAPWHNAVLKNHKEVDSTLKQISRLGLPVREQDLPKNWDSLAALDLILKNTARDARIFDAGGTTYSMILPWLFLYGYRNLSVGNLEYNRTFNFGPIIHHKSDITQSGLESQSFDAITCLSVIEHGVELTAYFREMSRILKPGGFLITSADYFDVPIDTRGQTAYGAPVHVFTRDEIVEALNIAGGFGLKPLGPIDLSTDKRVVYWEACDLHFTFIIFSLQKVMGS